MPFYTFTLQPGSGRSTTQEYPNEEAAKRQADRYAFALVQNNRPMSQGERITVRNASGGLIHEAHLSVAAMSPPC